MIIKCQVCGKEFDKSSSRNKHEKEKCMKQKRELKIGDKLKCTKFVDFCDGTCHNVGDVLEVSKDDVAYYKIFLNINYQIV